MAATVRPAGPTESHQRVRELHDDARDDGFEAVIRREWPVLVRVASRYRGPAVEVDDVLQEAVTRTYAAWQRGRVTEDLARYVTVTVRNVAIGLQRKHRAASRALDRLAGLDALDATVEPAEVGLSSEAVRDILAGLPERCRGVIELRVLQGWSEEAVAQELLIARGTVKSRCSRCLALLARMAEW